MNIIIVALCIYALSTLIVDYDGAFGLFKKLKSVKFLKEVTYCPVCSAFYIALPFLFILPPLELLAAYGLVIAINRFEP